MPPDTGWVRWSRSPGAGRVRGRVVAVVLAAMLLPALLAGQSSAQASAVAAPAPPEVEVATVRPVAGPAVADRFDRSWPADPPWDACPRPVWPGTRMVGSPGLGRRVLVLGDSLTRESRVSTARLLRAGGWTPSFRCWGSRRLDWGLAQITRARSLRQLPGTIVVALGTNDISWVDEQTTARRVDALLDRIGPGRRILWVDLHLTRSAWLDARAARFNALLRAQARARPNLTVIGWHRVAAAHRIGGGDGIHYGPRGYRLRARVIAQAVSRGVSGR